MRHTAPPQASTAKLDTSRTAGLFLQRKCACGSSASALTGECEECGKKGQLGLQTKLAISDSGDAYEQEADRIADQVLAMASLPTPQVTPVRVQRFAGYAAHGSESVPASVERTLAGSGKPLEPVVRLDMEDRFGHDFSKVRIHTGSTAEQSAKDVRAHAYTVGHDIVFGTNQFSPGSLDGKRLLAHELTHVMQQGRANDLAGRQDERAAAVTKPGSGAAHTTAPDNTLQRQSCDPLDPFCEAKKEKEDKPKDEKTARVYEACPDTCKTFAPVEVAPGVFVTLCNDEIATGPAKVTAQGCTPGRLGKVGLLSGTPAWQLPKAAGKSCAAYSFCTPHEVGIQKPPDTANIQIGYIQTIENALSGGVYYKREAGRWVWAGNSWECIKNVRDGEAGSAAPWYGNVSGSAGPQPYTGCPLMSDAPWVSLPSGQNIKCVDHLYDRPEWSLRRLRIDGVFHVWLVAKVNGGAPIYIHHWTIKDWVVYELNDDADPCNKTGWVKLVDEKTVASKGPGKGSAAPVLTGKVPAEMDKSKKDCSAPPSTDLKDKPCAKLPTVETKPTGAKP